MLRHLDSDRIADALSECSPLGSSWSGVVYRSASPRYANRDDLLTGQGSKKVGGRWNPPNSVATVYTSLDLHVALDEALAQFRVYALPSAKALPRVLVAVRVRLQRVLDLSLPDVLTTLKVTRRQLLADDWRGIGKRRRESLSQAMGRLAWLGGWEGLLVPSAARENSVNLIIFPGNLTPPRSWIRLLNPEELPPPPEPDR